MSRPGLISIGPASRRSFLRSCAGCAAWLAGGCAGAAASPAHSLLPQVKARVRLVFIHPDPKIEGWPYQGYDYESRKKMLLARLERGCPDVEFSPAAMTWVEEAEKMLAADEGKGIDGYAVYILGIPSNASRAIAMSGKPAVLIDDLYGGTGSFLGHYPAARKAGKPVVGVSSSRPADVCEAINTFSALRKLKASRILVVTPRDMQKTIDAIQANLGCTILNIPAEELNAAWKAADPKAAADQAAAWIRRADRVVEPRPEEIRNSAAMYLAMASLLEKHRAQAIAVDCLELFYKKRMFAYPCLGFFQMNNDGLVGACEADLTSASTMLLMRYLTGRPGYISDPVLDTAKNQIIYAHCVAPSKVHGPEGPESPYEIRDHSEDRKGAAIRSILPLNETLSTLEFVSHARTVVFHLSRAIDNLEEDRACRTKLVAEVRDARRLMEGWDFGWHRVTVYGDWRTRVANTAALLGWKFVEEG
ncbi:MAG: hypothetical protein WHT08_16700 [Bryobacteraceae bacterium]|jgi:hypothetical protein